jgi:membrane fusion protein
VMDKVMLSLIPKDTKLEGELLIPSSAVGFVEVGQKALLKYRAFPYQEFGLYESRIERIDTNTLSKQDSNSPIALEEPFYRAIVSIKQHHIVAYGKKWPLKPGMLVDVVILCEERTLLQWILSPIYSIRGSLTS